MTSAAQKLVLAFLTITVLIGCARTAPIYSVAEMPVVANKPDPTADDVSKAIIRAGATLGWQMIQTQPGLIVGTFRVRESTAVVDVNYTPKSYSIKYKDSTNFRYDGENIHKVYNQSVQSLDKGIRAQLSTLF